jgi:hypothetical protein
LLVTQTEGGSPQDLAAELELDGPDENGVYPIHLAAQAGLTEVRMIQLHLSFGSLSVEEGVLLMSRREY